ncbi:MAG: sulfotransferase [Gemmataceae bacterium]|nr:sulfotransferase [Gemmataceae bacterium]
MKQLPVDLRPLWWGRSNLRPWLRLLARQHYAFERSLWPRVLRTTLNCAAVSALGMIQEVFHGRDIRRTPVDHPPLFVLGHWRSGTTYLHNLLSQDERHTYPTHYDCAAPGHFLLTASLVHRWRGAAVKGRRAMDNVGVSLETPAEDEVGLSVMGVPSPYLDSAFPNQPFLYQKYLDLENVPRQARERWKKAVMRFWKSLLYRRPGRLLLKSPTHTARIKILLEMFPDARFVHIVRNPYPVFASMQKTLAAMWNRTSLQSPPFPGRDEFILATYPLLMDRLEAGRRLVDPSRFHELRYEDLVLDPIGQVQAVYEHLDLGGFERVKPRLERYLEGLGSYRANTHEASAAFDAEITSRWGRFIDHYGYGRRPAAGAE